MCNLICRIFVLPAYSSPIIYGDAVIGLLPRCLLSMILHHPIPMLMHVMVIVLEMQR